MNQEQQDLRQAMKPNDRCYIVYMIYLLYGIGILLPWNILTSCMDFLKERMPEHKPASSYPFAINIFLFTMQVVTVIYLYRVSFSLRLIPTFLGLAAYMIAVPFCADIGGATAYYAVFGLCLACGFFCGIC